MKSIQHILVTATTYTGDSDDIQKKIYTGQPTSPSLAMAGSSPAAAFLTMAARAYRF